MQLWIGWRIEVVGFQFNATCSRPARGAPQYPLARHSPYRYVVHEAIHEAHRRLPERVRSQYTYLNRTAWHETPAGCCTKNHQAQAHDDVVGLVPAYRSGIYESGSWAHVRRSLAMLASRQVRLCKDCGYMTALQRRIKSWVLLLNPS